MSRFLFLLIASLFVGCQTCHVGQSCQPCGTSSQKCGSEFCPPKHVKYCRWMDEFLHRHHAVKLAKRQLKKVDDCQRVSCDYQRGFQQAYIDVAMGESGEVPPAAPMEYWKAKLRNCEGHSRADDWFQGYAAGASFAINQVACPNRVASSGMGGYPPETHGQFCPADCP